MKILHKNTKQIILDLPLLTNLHGADLRDADLRGANLRGADLHGADLRDANLCGANLRDANLCGANLYDANLRGANLRDANLCDANLCGANLYDANLYGAKNIIQFGAMPTSGRMIYAVRGTDTKVQAGCFWGTIDELTTRVKATHNCPVYLSIIKTIKIWSTLTN